MITDVIALAVLCLATLAIFSPSIPTGIIGSLGLVLIGGAAIVSTDDSAFANAQRLEQIVVALQLGLLLVIAQVALLVWRSNTGTTTPRRRTTDLGAFSDTRPMAERRS